MSEIQPIDQNILVLEAKEEATEMPKDLDSGETRKLEPRVRKSENRLTRVETLVEGIAENQQRHYEERKKEHKELYDAVTAITVRLGPVTGPNEAIPIQQHQLGAYKKAGVVAGAGLGGAGIIYLILDLLMAYFGSKQAQAPVHPPAPQQPPAITAPAHPPATAPQR